MDEQEIRGIVAAERLSLCDALDGLDDGQWSTPSLCGGWTVHEVVAHLTLPTRTSFPAMVLEMARARGDFDRMTDRTARRRAARSQPPALVAQLRGTADSGECLAAARWIRSSTSSSTRRTSACRSAYGGGCRSLPRPPR